MTLQTKEFDLNILATVKKAFEDGLGLDFEITRGEETFNITFFDVETRSEIKEIARIEERFGATDY